MPPSTFHSPSQSIPDGNFIPGLKPGMDAPQYDTASADESASQSNSESDYDSASQSYSESDGDSASESDNESLVGGKEDTKKLLSAAKESIQQVRNVY